MNTLFPNFKQLLPNPQQLVSATVRWASKKTGTSTQNTKGSGIKKHRGWKRSDGQLVTSGTLLVTQNTLRFHPGLNVGMGRNGTLYAKIPGNVMVTCEKTDPNWDHTWVQRCHGHRKTDTFFKKYYNVIPLPQHKNFVLKEQV